MSKHEFFSCDVCDRNDEEYPDLEIFNFSPKNRTQYQLAPASTNDGYDDFHLCIDCINIIKQSDVLTGELEP